MTTKGTLQGIYWRSREGKDFSQVLTEFLSPSKELEQLNYLWWEGRGFLSPLGGAKEKSVSIGCGSLKVVSKIQHLKNTLSKDVKRVFGEHSPTLKHSKEKEDPYGSV